MFDPPEEQPMVMEIGAKDVDSPAGRALAKKAALEGIVLLKNDRSILPMDGVFAFVCVCVCVCLSHVSLTHVLIQK
jgi:xylan 1,4-beta-xylosidase